MSYNIARRNHNSRPSSPVYLHVVKDTPIHVCMDGEEADYICDPARNITKVRRPKKPGVNIGTSKLMGKKNLENKRVRSMSPPWVPPPGKSTRGSKSPLGPFWNEDEANIGQQEKYESKINELMGEVGDLREQLDRERCREELLRSNETLRAHEDKIEELKQEIDLVEKENNNLRDGLDKNKADVACDESDILVDALIETELSAGRCQHQMQHVFDNLKNILKESHRISTRDIDRICGYFHDTESRLFEFKANSNDLRGMLKLFQQREVVGRESLLQDNSFLQHRRKELEEICDKLQLDVRDKDTVIDDLRRQLARKSDESINFASTHESLENVKGHLQQQLKQKSGDCNRMAVQIRTLESELTKERLDKEHIIDMMKNSKDRTYDDRDTLKKAARAQKQRAQKAEETIHELSSLLAEKDKQLDQMMSRDLDHDEKGALCQSTQCEMDYRDTQEQLGHLNNIAEENELLHNKISHSNHENVIMSLKRENENLRSIADQCESRLKDVEREMESLRRNIGEEDIRDDGQLEKLSQLLHKLEASDKTNQMSQLRIEELERKIKNYESQALDLKNSLQQKESTVVDNRCKADDLVRENAALLRQLEAALIDSRRNADNAREKISTKDRSLQSRIHDIESQLAQQRAECTKWRRSAEENERKYNSKLQDVRIQLEQAETTNRSMHTYVQFLKKSYANVFGDMPLPNGLSNPSPSHLGGPICF